MSKIKKSQIAVIVTILIISTLTGTVLYLLQSFNQIAIPEKNTLSSDTSLKNSNTPNTNATPVAYEIKPVAQGLVVPWSVGFTSENRMLVTERPGRLRVVLDGKLQDKPLHIFEEVTSESEEGLMGVAVDPDYSTNRYLFFMYAYKKDVALKIKIVRFADTGDSLVDGVTLLDNIDCTQNHAGGRLAFGPDKKLYITTGDATNSALPQDLSSLNGKLLRMNNDGSAPNDNPFPNSLVWSYGHRNSQGIAWDKDGVLLSTEHGPSIFDGPAGGDEVNQINKGANYGWPMVSHGRKIDGSENELILMTPATAPGGMVYYAGNEFPQLKYSFIFAGLAGRALYQIKTDGQKTVQNVNYQKLEGIDAGRIRDVVQSPEGKLYFLTSNRDYRGTPKPGDDKIYQLVPKNKIN
jgi:aldose sugar dehydrogenase